MSGSAALTNRQSTLRAIARGLLFLLTNLAIVPLYAASIGPLHRLKRPLQVLWCRGMRAAAGLKVQTIGQCYQGGPILFVANHTSYLDIPVVSAAVEGCFVAKAEVAGWPIFGTVGRVTRAVFVKRVGVEARGQANELLSRLLTGENLILFPEGTSTDGTAVAPFKSSLFGIAEKLPAGLGLTIQPLAITYTHDAGGEPLLGERRALYCWFGDALMAPHIWRVLGMKGCRAELRFHPPITVPPHADRKRLAAEAQASVAKGVAIANAAMAAGALPAPTPVVAVAEADDRAGMTSSFNAAESVAAVGARRSGRAGR